MGNEHQGETSNMNIGVRRFFSFGVSAMLIWSFSSPVNASEFSNGAVKKKYELSRTVIYKDIQFNSTVPQKVKVLEMKIGDPSTYINIGVPEPINKLMTVSSRAKSENRNGHYVIGAVNASYFREKLPTGIITENNRIINYGMETGNPNSPMNRQVAFGITASNKAILDYANPKLTFSYNNKTIPLYTMNATRYQGTGTLYTPSHYSNSTEANQWGTEIIVTEPSKDTKKFSFGDTISGKVAKITRFNQSANNTIPANGFVISLHGQDLSKKVSDLKIGDSISISASINPRLQDAKFLLGSGPMLVRNGNIEISMLQTDNFVDTRNPRTAVGIDSQTNRVFLVTNDGRNYSRGSTLQSLAKYLISLGADYAMNLDGGGSSAMVIRKPGMSYPTLVNSPSDGYERSVSAILQIVNTDPYFKDLKYTHWAIEPILELTKQKIISGYPDGTFKPDNNITRLDAATLISKHMGLDVKNITDQHFNDVNKATYGYETISAVAKENIINGYKDGSFRPNAYLTRAEMASIMDRAYELTGMANKNFKDVAKIHWAYSPIMTVVANDIASGYEDGTYRPSKKITRAEFSSMLQRYTTR
jgi:exopolysaccharide biosynthesis protein